MVKTAKSKLLIYQKNEQIKYNKQNRCKNKHTKNKKMFEKVLTKYKKVNIIKTNIFLFYRRKK